MHYFFYFSCADPIVSFYTDSFPPNSGKHTVYFLEEIRYNEIQYRIVPFFGRGLLYYK